MLFKLVDLIATILVFWLCKKVYLRWHITVLSPIITCLAMMVAILSLSHVSYHQYISGAKWLEYMLQPATVAFALPLYKYWPALKKHAATVVTGMLVGSLTAITSSVMLANWMHVGQFSNSLAPRSVTTPIAMAISGSIGGSPVLTSVFVIITALIGIVVAPLIIRVLKLKSAVAHGAIFGTGAHVLGTTKAFEMSTMAGAVGSISMIMSAISTLIFAPMIVPSILHFVQP